MSQSSRISDLATRIAQEIKAVRAIVTGKLDTSAAPELIRDTIGASLVPGANVSITVDDGADTITISASGGGGGGGITTEDAVDAVATALVVTGNASKAYNDALDTLTVDVPQGIPAVVSEPAGPVGLVWAKDLGGGAYTLQIKTA